MQTELFEQEDSDTPILSVSEITREVRKSLEKQFFQIWIRGEISNLRAHSSGHYYFTLKDSKSQIKAVLFRGDAMGSSYIPKEGDECLAFGDITVYEPRGDYQLRVRHIMPDGLGGLKAKFEELKKRLLDEGLFDEDRKKALPEIPTVVGVVTSLNGAALQDFISILRRREWGGTVYLFNSSVQGIGAPSELRKAVKLAQQIKGIELLVITRGGGSMEDLWSFNDEQLVRDIAACEIPTISAVGHQTDFVLTDFVADLRAETPSGAAEWISSKFLTKKEAVEGVSDSLKQIPKQIFSKTKDRLELLKVRLESSSPIAQIEKHHQLIDEFESRLKMILHHRKQRVEDQMKSISHRLTNCSLNSTLKKGFSYLKDSNGNIICSSQSLSKEDRVVVTFEDGTRNLKVTD